MSAAVGRSSKGGLALLVLCMAQFMLVLDISIVNVALPAIQADLGFSAANLQLIVTAYALTFGALLLLGGRAADLLGRRAIFIAGLVLFTAASLLCGLAQSEAMLIAARALQGVGGALVSPAALSLLTTTFAEGESRNRALGVWGAVAAGGAVAGLLFGGVLTDLASWRWVFLVNVPVGALVLLGAKRVLDESRGPGRQGLDLPGAALVTLGLMALVYGLTRGEREGFDDTLTLGMLFGSVVLLAAFAVVEQRVADPLVPLRIFGLRTLSGANATTLLMAAVIVGNSFFLTLYFQRVLGYSPIETGLAFLPITITIGLTAGIASSLVGRTGARPLLVAGMLALAVGCVLLSQIAPGGSYLTDVLPGMLFTAVGLGLGFPIGTLAATAGVAPEQQGLASGLINTSQQIGTAIGLAVLATIAGSVTEGATGSTQQALTAGFEAAFLVAAGLALTGALTAALLVRDHDTRAELDRRELEGTATPVSSTGHSSPCQPAVTRIAHATAKGTANDRL